MFFTYFLFLTSNYDAIFKYFLASIFSSCFFKSGISPLRHSQMSYMLTKSRANVILLLMDNFITKPGLAMFHYQIVEHAPVGKGEMEIMLVTRL